jgi:DNA (cytosine-5)-methyltransferase 1
MMNSDNPRLRRFTFADLFCGIGGMRLAMESAGCRCIFSSDWDAHAQRTYAANFGETPFGDIRLVQSAMIPNHEILTAGFPCQPFSISGVSKKNSLGWAHGFADETQGTLFFEVARVISDKRPEAFILENVKNLKSHDRGRTFRVMLQTLENELGYWVNYRIFDARYFVPQHRERIFIVGFRQPRRFSWPVLPRGETKIVDILDAAPEKNTH